MELKSIFLILLGIVSAVYLSTLFFKQGYFQMILKACLLPLILAVYISGSKQILLPVVFALVFGWAGDIFLLKISALRFFRLGLASFLIGHIFYIAAMYGFTQPFDMPVLYASAAAAAVLGFFLFRIIRPVKDMKIPVIVYEIVIMAMAVFAVQIYTLQNAAFGVFVLAGSLCFVVSDSLLAYETFRKKTKFSYFCVMLTYISAQLLIVLGFCAAGT